jgi:hypothetical protein
MLTLRAGEGVAGQRLEFRRLCCGERPDVAANALEPLVAMFRSVAVPTRSGVRSFVIATAQFARILRGHIIAETRGTFGTPGVAPL